MPKSFHNATQQGPTNTLSDIWLTPKWIIDRIGVSNLDPCGWKPGGQLIVETAKNYLTEEENGLEYDWSKIGGSVYCNPPYSELKEWLAKCADYHAKTGNDVIVLCFCRTETKAFQQNVKSATGINLINKRIKFLDYTGKEHSNGNAPSCLIAWGEEAYNRIKHIDGIHLRIEKQKE